MISSNISASEQTYDPHRRLHRRRRRPNPADSSGPVVHRSHDPGETERYMHCDTPYHRMEPMRISFIQLTAFRTNWHRLRMTDEDLQELELPILDNPTGPPVMSGSGGLRKIRFAPTGPTTGRRLCPAVRRNGFRWPAHSSPNPNCCCSTSRSALSTR